MAIVLIEKSYQLSNLVLEAGFLILVQIVELFSDSDYHSSIMKHSLFFLILGFILHHPVCAGLETSPTVSIMEGAEISHALLKTDRVVIQMSFEKDITKDYEITDQMWITEFLGILSSASARKDDYCFCIWYPSYNFYKGEDKLMRLTLPHGNKLRLEGGCLSGDYLVGEAVVAEIWDHTKSKIKNIDNAVKDLGAFELK